MWRSRSLSVGGASITIATCVGMMSQAKLIVNMVPEGVMKRRRLIGLLVLVAAAATIAVVMWPRLSRELGRTSGRQPSEYRVLSEVEKDAVPPLLAVPWGQGRDERVNKIVALHGATEDQVRAELGEPNQTYEFPVEDGGDEFRIELWNTYPPDAVRSRGVRILEWQ